jgi:hypothetical protein
MMQWTPIDHTTMGRIWRWYVSRDDTWKLRPWYLKPLRICLWSQGVIIFIPGLRFIVWKA